MSLGALGAIASMAALGSARAAGTVNALTQHNDNFRTGANLEEALLDRSTVGPNSFGRLFSLPVDGYIQAQPLYVSSLSTPSGPRNVVYVATRHNSDLCLRRGRRRPAPVASPIRPAHTDERPAGGLGRRLARIFGIDPPRSVATPRR
jgi:hypothetical protein